MVLALCTSSNVDDIHIKFHEDIMNGFQVIEHTRFCDRVQENNSKSKNARVVVFALSTSSYVE